MHKGTIDVWVITDSMFAESRGQTVSTTPNLQPFCFKDVKLSQPVMDLYKFVKNIRFIPQSIDVSHCFYFVHIDYIQPSHSRQEQENYKKQNQQMVDEEIQSAAYEQQRKQIFEKMKNQSTLDEETREDFQDFSITIKKLLKFYLGSDYKEKVKQKNVQMKIYIMWKQATLQLRSNPKKMVTIPVVRGDTFDELYRRFLKFYPQVHQNIRRLIYTCGMRTQQHYLVKHRIYEGENKESEEVIQAEQKNELSPKRSFKLSNPTAEIYQQRGQYIMRLLE